MLEFGVLGFMVSGLWFKAYNTSVNAFKKHLNKSYKTLFQMF